MVSFWKIDEAEQLRMFRENPYREHTNDELKAILLEKGLLIERYKFRVQSQGIFFPLLLTVFAIYTAIGCWMFKANTENFGVWMLLGIAFMAICYIWIYAKLEWNYEHRVGELLADQATIKERLDKAAENGSLPANVGNGVTIVEE